MGAMNMPSTASGTTLIAQIRGLARAQMARRRMKTATT
jgi:hypothetical protein